MAELARAFRSGLGRAQGFAGLARVSKPLARKAPVTAFPKGVRAQCLFKNSKPRVIWRGFREPERSELLFVSTGSGRKLRQMAVDLDSWTGTSINP
jgi:hypothetical protein